MIRVFVYGTLRKGMYNHDTYFKKHALHHRQAYVKGELYAIKDKVYPALIPGDRMIVGEIIDLDDSISIQEVDDMEGYLQEGDINNEYDKVLCDIYDMDMTTVIDRLPVYMYNLKNPRLKDSLDGLIACNDYVAYQKVKQ